MIECLWANDGCVEQKTKINCKYPISNGECLTKKNIIRKLIFFLANLNPYFPWVIYSI
jgi:hypothetical protein